jgi:hypothetical protein
MKIVILIVSVLAALLGGLWFLQGIGLVHLDPVACVGECTPLEGPSMQWAVIGGVVLALGLLGISYGLKKSR